MSKRKYPRIGSDLKIKNKSECSCCKEPAIRHVDVEVNWFRGDDDVFKLCAQHHEAAKQDNWDKIYQDFRAKHPVKP